jgi:secreted trypsin-like serine protease
MRNPARRGWVAALGVAASLIGTCAFALDPAIVGGTTAPAGKWPFQVALLLASIANDFNAEECGGSLIDEFHVVTAGHCVYSAHQPNKTVPAL